MVRFCTSATALRALEAQLALVHVLPVQRTPLAVRHSMARMLEDLRLLEEEQRRRVRYMQEEMAALRVHLDSETIVNAETPTISVAPTETPESDPGGPSRQPKRRGRIPKS